MAVTSTMLPLGTPLPEFALPDVVSGATVFSADMAGKPTLLMVICNHCPYVVRMKAELARLGREILERGVGVLAISANDAGRYPDDGPAQMKADAEGFEYPFPYLFDEQQTVASALQAMCTPEFYLFDADGKLTYRGRFDDSTPGNGKPVTGADLMGAVAALLSGAPPVDSQFPSMGCSVKWKPGRVPSYVSG